MSPTVLRIARRNGIMPGINVGGWHRRVLIPTHLEGEGCYLQCLTPVDIWVVINCGI